ncbi:hypothetical protein [Morganella morganii]|uniref:hypothetical protein n=1 Tax=Morganella morganii TaxID=582 RepID=UPI001BDB797E|nr:hypothetical protein [Morganella morganii]MBT0463176.1 hypothetical protein [Morganella morganii subsp. morganii]
MSVFKLMATTLGVATVALATYCAWQTAAEAADNEDATSAEKLAAGLSAALACSAVLGGTLDRLLGRLFPR